jgi:hypothetical protein
VLCKQIFQGPRSQTSPLEVISTSGEYQLDREPSTLRIVSNKFVNSDGQIEKLVRDGRAGVRTGGPVVIEPAIGEML